jgi:hypothetical protein
LCLVPLVPIKEIFFHVRSCSCPTKGRLIAASCRFFSDIELTDGRGVNWDNGNGRGNCFKGRGRHGIGFAIELGRKRQAVDQRVVILMALYMFDERVRRKTGEKCHDDRKKIPFRHKGGQRIDGLPGLHFPNPVDEALVVTEDVDCKLARSTKAEGFQQEDYSNEKSRHGVRIRPVRTGIRASSRALDSQNATSANGGHGAVAPAVRLGIAISYYQCEKRIGD